MSEQNNQIPQGASVPALVWGIVGLSCACTFWLSFLGIIFSAIGLNKADDYVRTYGVLTAKASVGRALSKAGIIIGSIFTALSVITVTLTILITLNAIV